MAAEWAATSGSSSVTLPICFRVTYKRWPFLTYCTLVISLVFSPSVYQPGLWWAPRILTVSFKVTRAHDGHSSVRRPILLQNPMKRSSAVDPAGPLEASPHNALMKNFAHIQTLPESELDNQFSATCAVNLLHWNISQCHDDGNTEP